MLRPHVEDELLDLALFGLDRRKRVAGGVRDLATLRVGGGYGLSTFGNLLAEPEKALEERFGARRAARHIHIDRHDRVDTLKRGVAVPELAARRRAVAHGD